MILRRSLRRFVRWVGGPLGRLTIRGRAVLSAGLSAGACSVLLGQQDLLRVGVLLAAVPLLTTAALGRTRYRLACSRTITPNRVQVGSVAEVLVEVANVSTSRCGTVLAMEQVPYRLGNNPRFVLPGLEPGEHRVVSYPVRGEVRGRYRLGPLSLTLPDPFGMSEHRRSFTAQEELVVVPAVVPLPQIWLGGDWSGSGDTRPRAVAAAGEDDVTTREYHQGDDLRRVHWRSTARRGELMVRREEQPWQSRATLLLDRRRGSHPDEGAASFEWAVAMVASVAVHLADRGYAIRLADGAQDRADIVHPWTSGNAGHLGAAHVLDTLASTSLAGSMELRRAVQGATRSATGGLVVAVLGALGQDDIAVLAALVQPGCRGVALLATPAPSGHPADHPADHPTAYPAVAGRPMIRPEEHLRAAGWDVVAARPGENPAQTWSRVAPQGSGNHGAPTARRSR
jgi:uncharacterized protein (DUF58 family)